MLSTNWPDALVKDFFNGVLSSPNPSANASVTKDAAAPLSNMALPHCCWLPLLAKNMAVEMMEVVGSLAVVIIMFPLDESVVVMLVLVLVVGETGLELELASRCSSVWCLAPQVLHVKDEVHSLRW